MKSLFWFIWTDPFVCYDVEAKLLLEVQDRSSVIEYCNENVNQHWEHEVHVSF